MSDFMKLIQWEPSCFT